MNPHVTLYSYIFPIYVLIYVLYIPYCFHMSCGLGADAMMKEIFHRGPISCGVDANPLLNYESGHWAPHWPGFRSLPWRSKYLYIYIHLVNYIYIYTCICVYAHVCMYIFVYIYIHTYIYIYMYIVHVCVCMECNVM